MGANYDFSGWATRNNILCSDGRTIRRNAFIDQDGMTVPLVWNHRHDDPDNVLGHAMLQNRDDGVYAYCTLNNTERGQNVKKMIQNGDITNLSIFANHLKQNGGDVIHGAIREVSLVLAGANPGAFIDSVMMHGEDSEEEGYIFNDFEGLYLNHGDEEYVDERDDTMSHSMEEVLDTLTSEQMDAVYELVGNVLEDSDYVNHSMEDILGTLNEEQMDAVYELVGYAIEDAEQQFAHADEDMEDEDEDDDEETVADVFNTMSKKQKTVVYALIGKAIEDAKGGSAEHYDSDEYYLMHAADEDEETVADVFNTLTEKQKTVAYALIGQAIEDAKNNNMDEEESEGDEVMKHNVFDSTVNNEVETLSHADMEAIFSDAQHYGSLKDAVLAHGIDNIEYLFPEAQNIDKTPGFLTEKDEWVKAVMNGVRHTPFSRIRSIIADITEPEARAKGYIKGNRKYEEVITLLKRITLPTTIYKKQKLDRDDIIDIKDFDVVAWIKGEMRVKLDEEIARAILISDGRDVLSEDKINTNNVRPIWLDDDFYTIKQPVVVTATMNDNDKAKAFIRAAVKARKDYKGSGNCVMFMSEEMRTNCLLAEDGIGRTLYDTEDKLANALLVKKIFTVPFFENASRIAADGTTHFLGGLIIDLNDYNVGADRGGEVNMFDDFDIDYNQQKYLIETRISGALVKPYSAIALELVHALILNMMAEDPTTTLLGKQVSELQTGVVVNDNFIQGTLNYVTGYTGYSGNPELQSGNFLALKFEATDDATTTVELIGGYSGAITLDEDMNAVVRIANKNTQKIKVTTTVGGQSLTKVYGLKSLICATA